MRFIIIIESGPSLSVVLGGLISLRRLLRAVVGEREPFEGESMARLFSVVEMGAGDGADLPDIMDAQSESTSTVAALASTRGFFSTFL